ncbi:MAG: pirin family protein [Acidimicrobiales bacterium]
MTERTISSTTIAEAQPGTGILHPFPTAELAHVDPFVFLDTGAPRDLGDGEIYVGPHPHRGVQPVSLLFRGRIEHRDSLGTHRVIDSGGMQWLVSGSGALHEEVLAGDEAGVFHMAQLWVNVPAALKLDAPEHHAVPAEQIPVIDDMGEAAHVRLYAGPLGNHVGPAPLPTPVLVAHVSLTAGGSIRIPVPPGWNVAACVVAGSIDGDGTTLEPGATPVYADDGDHVLLRSASGGEVLFMAGEPIGESIAMGGGFVMNTRDEITAAFDDYESGRMGQLSASR